MRYTPSGVPVTNFSVAVSRTWTGQDGQRQEKTTWFSVTCWRKQAEVVSQYLHKGSKVMVVGEMEDAEVYTDRDGNPKSSLKVTAQTVKFLSSREGGESGADADYDHSGSNYASTATAGKKQRDEDIPF